MKALLDPLRSVVRPEYREKFYYLVGVAVVALGSVGMVDDNAVATVAQLVISCAGLLFALLYSTSELRVALYGVCTAVQAVAALWSLGNGSAWAAILSMATAVLGTHVAAAKTPTGIALPRRLPDDFSRAQHRLGDDWPEVDR